MNKVYLHYHKSKKNILFYYFCALIPPIIYGIYKNGYLLYQKDYISLLGFFRPLYFVLIPFCLITLVKLLKYKKIVIDFDTFSWVCIGLFMPPQMSILIYLVCMCIFIVLSTLLPKKINFPVLSKLLMVILLYFINKYTYANLLEINIAYSFSFMDLIWGRSVGGICATSVVYSLICYIILSLSSYYKKEIPVIGLLVFMILSLIRLCIVKDPGVVFTNFAGICLAIILLGTDFKYTPYLPKARIIYAFLLGLLVFLFNLFNSYEGVFIAILILSCIYFVFDNFINKFRSTK